MQPAGAVRDFGRFSVAAISRFSTPARAVAPSASLSQTGWPLGPDVMLDRFEIERLLAAEGRIEARRADAHGVAQVVHRGRRKALAPKQQHGGLKRRVAIKFPWPSDNRHRRLFL